MIDNINTRLQQKYVEATIKARNFIDNLKSKAVSEHGGIFEYFAIILVGLALVCIAGAVLYSLAPETTRNLYTRAINRVTSTFGL